MFNVSDVYINHTVLLFKDEVEPKDQQAKKNETVDQQVQTGETVLHIIMLLLTIMIV